MREGEREHTHTHALILTAEVYKGIQVEKNRTKITLVCVRLFAQIKKWKEIEKYP